MPTNPIAAHTIPANPVVSAIKPLHSPIDKVRRTIQGQDSMVLADIYEEEINMAVWQRDLSPSVQQAVEILLSTKPSFQAAMALSPQQAKASLDEVLGVNAGDDSDNSDSSKLSALSENIAELIDMFCCLFDLEEAGLRLASLDKAMCPRFHVDKLQCRLVTTYQGVATEWIPNNLINRIHLGKANSSHLYEDASDIQRINCGDVALLKGELWEGNEQAGLVHRSPKPTAGENRLLLTLDFVH